METAAAILARGQQTIHGGEDRIDTDSDSLTLVLSSGGVDSTTAIALALALAEPTAVETLFVDYGQAAARAEKRASAAVAMHYEVKRRTLRLDGLSFGSGEIRGRNAFLLQTALLAYPRASGSVVIAVHSGTPYADCGPDFIRLIQRSYDTAAAGTITIAAPFAAMKKEAVFALAAERGVPLELTYSCEAANVPCRVCLSCRDRGAARARA